MDLFDAIGRRHSYRGMFTDAPAPRSDLQRIVEAGIQAPSACNEQVVSFVIVDDPQLLGQIAEVLDNKPVCRTARAMIVCVVAPRPVFARTSFAAEDCAAAVENMLLAITALGYAGVWLDGALRSEDRAGRIGRLVGVPEELLVRVLIPLGVPVEPGRQAARLPFDRRAWFNQYGGSPSLQATS